MILGLPHKDNGFRKTKNVIKYKLDFSLNLRKERGNMAADIVKVKDVLIGDGVPKICVPINGRSEEEILRQLDLALQKPCDLLEWRADFYLTYQDTNTWKPMLDQIRGRTDKPLIFTLRSESEGGQSNLRRSDGLALLRDVAEQGDVDILDIELFEEDGSLDEAKMEFLVDTAHSNNKKVILSNHDFDKTPDMDAIVKRLQAMERLGADLPKVAYMPLNEDDVKVLLEAARIVSSQFLRKPFIAISMGDLGKESRICGGAHGSAISFAMPPSPGGQNATAPGQMKAEDLYQCICETYKTDV
jgi:3-dehydroquinate dehydratase I